MENQGMGFNKLGLLLSIVTIINVGCGYGLKGVHRADGLTAEESNRRKQKLRLEFNVPLADEPPPLQTEEIRKSDPDYKPTSYLSIPAGVVVTFREKFEIDSQDPRVTKVLENDRIGMYFKFPQKLGSKKINLKGLELKVTTKEKLGGLEQYPGALLLTFRDPTVTGSDETIDLPIKCRYYGEHIDDKNMVSYQAQLSRDCTIDEFQNKILSSGGLLLDFADVNP